MNDEFEKCGRKWPWPVLGDGIKIGVSRQYMLQLLFSLSTEVYYAVIRRLHTDISLGLLLTLKMEMIFSFELSVDFHQTTRHHIPGSRILQRSL
jgi:hypothetical protein